jgi:hypothetical protein
MSQMETMRATGLSRISKTVLCVLALLTGFLAVAQPAGATKMIARNASSVQIKVDGKGRAVVYYTRGGKRYHPAFWGAVNARPPSRTVPQVKFRADYSGGTMRLGFPLWKTIRNRCRPYDGPPLPLLVTACKAPDGSYWALQRWQRLLPFLGYRPWTSLQRARELHLSHWTGPLARLELYADWAYGGKRHHLFGRLSYRGNAVYGFAYSNTLGPLDGYGRNVFLDTYNSRYGAGWRRENAFLSHRPGGNFCYLFFNRPSYYDSTTRPPGNGKRYRGTVLGPGVTPIVRSYVKGLPNYDPDNPEHVDHEREMNELGDRFAARDTKCHVH